MNDGNDTQPDTEETPAAQPETTAQEPPQVVTGDSLFNSSETEDTAADQPYPDNDVSWTAPEFVAHPKSSKWYMTLGIVIAVLAGIGYLIGRDIISTSVIVICGVLFGIYAGHKPRDVQYTINNRGVTIAGKPYSLDQFKSFSIVEDGGFASINLLPLKRFSPGLTICLAPDSKDAVASVLTDALPHDERARDPIDRLISRIRF